MRIKLFIGSKVDPRLVSTRLQSISDPLWRWLPSDQWHVTALFIGHRPEEELSGICDQLTSVLKTRSPFMLDGGELRTVPEDRTSMLWVRFAISKELNTLHAALAAALGTPPSPHTPYWPHITLARGNGQIPEMKNSPVIPMLPIDEISLFRSDPTPNGTLHTALRTWSLTNPNS